MTQLLVLSVGINAYTNLTDEYQLRYCANDAKIINDEYSQFDSLYNKSLLDTDATRSQILKCLTDIVNRARDDDHVIFNFAGHGFTTESEIQKISSKNTFICPSDFEEDYWGTTAINLSELNELFDKINSKSKLVIFDACHSGGALQRKLVQSKLREIKIEKLIDIIGKNKGYGILTACDSNEVARECEDLKHGVFTHSFIESLKEMESDEYLVSFDEVYNRVCEKVRLKTRNNQNPKAKRSDEDFKILKLPKNHSLNKKEISLDISLIPTSKIDKSNVYYPPNALNEFETVVIQLIQENRFVEIDKLFKDRVNTLYEKLSKPEISSSATREEAITYYDSCRKHLEPLTILINYILDYYDPKYFLENLEYIFQLEQLTKEIDGNHFIKEIPLVILTEIIFKVMTLAYKKKNSEILKTFLDYSVMNNYTGKELPIIYDLRVWVTELFTNIDLFIKYLFPLEKIDSNLFFRSEARNFTEVNFLFDCYSIKNSEYVSHPAYLALDDYSAPKRFAIKLLDPKIAKFVENVFPISIKDFINLSINRQKEISEWDQDRLFRRAYKEFHENSITALEKALTAYS